MKFIAAFALAALAGGIVSVPALAQDAAAGKKVFAGDAAGPPRHHGFGAGLQRIRDRLGRDGTRVGGQCCQKGRDHARRQDGPGAVMNQNSLGRVCGQCLQTSTHA